MKKVLSIIGIAFIIAIAIMVNPLKAAEKPTVKPPPTEYGTYADAVEMIRESMRSYYMRGTNIQYNYSKTVYPIGAPEEATSQDLNYSVCAAYTYSAHAEAFGMLYEKDVSEFPRYNYDILKVAKEEYEKNNTDGNFLIYYQNKENVKYIYGDKSPSSNANDFELIISQIQPGDLFVYTGHALIAYGVETNPKTGEKDVLILNSDQKQKIYTRIDGTSQLTHSMFESKRNSTGILDTIPEGTIKFLWLSDSSNFMNQDTKEFDCQQNECAIVRPFYNKNGKAVFNYNIDTAQYQKGKLRTKYPGLLIEKTVDVGDNNSVYLNDTLTYTIKVTNRSTIQPNGAKTYTTPFYITENLLSTVMFQSATNSGTYSNGKVTWKVNSLKPGESIELRYTAKVKNNIENISKTITSIGTFYSSENTSVTLTTGTVKNKIIPKINNLKPDYTKCYEEAIKTKSGLYLINEIYYCATEINFQFDKINFDDMFIKTAGSSPKSEAKIVKNENASLLSKQFNNMILNNYFNGLVLSNGLYYLPRFSGSPRAETINSSDFKNGDVLIYHITNSKYTKESGIYAYIYLNGKFVGKNGTGTTARNSFEYTYYDDIAGKLYGGYSKLTSDNKESILKFTNYQTLFDKDYYVILRPEQVIVEPYKIAVTTLPTKQKYIISKDNLDLSGGELTITNNDGTTTKLKLNDSKVKVSNFNNTKVGINKLDVYYENLSTTFEVEIISREISSISVATLPTQTQYKQNVENLNLKGGQINLLYNDGSKLLLGMTDLNITASGFDNTKPGKNIITLTYAGKSTTFEIEILPKQLEKIEVSQAPTKNKYIKSQEKLDLSGGKIKLIYSDKSTTTIDMSNANVKVTGFNNAKLGKNTITLTYSGKSTTFEVEIIDGKTNQIRIDTPPKKTKYILNQEKLDLTGGKLEVIYNNNKEIIDLTNPEIKVENFNNTSVGKNTLTITYKNLKTTMDIEIISKEIKELQVHSLPGNKGKVSKTADLNLSTGNIKVIYVDGTSDIVNMTDKNVDIVSINNNVLGVSKITMKYLNHELLLEFKYEVEVPDDDNQEQDNVTDEDNNDSNIDNEENNENIIDEEQDEKDKNKDKKNNLIVYIAIATGIVLAGVGTAIYLFQIKKKKLKDNI